MKGSSVLVVALCTALAAAAGCQSSQGPKFKLEGRRNTVKTEPAGARV